MIRLQLFERICGTREPAELPLDNFHPVTHKQVIQYNTIFGKQCSNRRVYLTLS